MNIAGNKVVNNQSNSGTEAKAMTNVEKARKANRLFIAARKARDFARANACRECRIIAMEAARKERKA